MRESNLIVDRNLEAFARIVAANYSRGQVGVYSSCGQTFPRVDITLEDMERSGEQFTADVLKLEAAFQWALHNRRMVSLLRCPGLNMRLRC
jgi:hypothetical protein